MDRSFFWRRLLLLFPECLETCEDGVRKEGSCCRGPQPGLTGCLQWDFSDLKAGRLAARQQIRSSESAASQRPCALGGNQPGSLAVMSLRRTHTVATKAPRDNSLWVLWDPPTKGRRRVATESAWREHGTPSCGKPHSLPRKVQI